MSADRTNLILLADAYKYSHHRLYYPGTTKIYSYLESRGGLFPNTVFYGLQYILKRYLAGTVITKEHIDEAESLMQGVFGSSMVFSRENFEYILNRHNGQLPVRIKAVPEGAVIPVGNVLMTIENTDPQCFWLTNFLETVLMQVWYPCTVATLSFEIRKLIEHYFELTASEDSYGSIAFALNDFGFRGVSSIESAGIGGSAHLLNFMGSDTVIASKFIQQYYNTAIVYGKSIPASEHSIMTQLGKEGERKTFSHILNAYPQGVLACVSDSYDIFHAVSELWGNTFKEQILNRDGVLVIRPDSGDPVKTLLKLFEILFDRFDFTINKKGYKVLPPQIRIIQGDGIDYHSISKIYSALRMSNISVENLVFGMGGALLQKVNRDTQKFAIKCSYTELDGKSFGVQKRPLEMNADGVILPSFKASKSGKLKLVNQKGIYTTVGEKELPYAADELITVFENGKIIHMHNFESVRNRVKACSFSTNEGVKNELDSVYV